MMRCLQRRSYTSTWLHSMSRNRGNESHSEKDRAKRLAKSAVPQALFFSALHTACVVCRRNAEMFLPCKPPKGLWCKPRRRTKHLISYVRKAKNARKNTLSAAFLKAGFFLRLRQFVQKGNKFQAVSIL